MDFGHINLVVMNNKTFFGLYFRVVGIDYDETQELFQIYFNGGANTITVPKSAEFKPFVDFNDLEGGLTTILNKRQNED